MKEISIQEAIQIRKQILRQFHDFCNKNQVNYSLGYGTLLGAVRHKDIIPWDDDIDIIMPRADFDKLEALSLKQKNSSDRYRFITHRTNSEIKTKIGYFIDFQTITKISGKGEDFHGIHIDIFPVDVLPYTSMTRKKLLIERRWLHFIIRMTGLHPNVHTGIKKIICFVAKFVFSIFDTDWALDRLNTISKATKIEQGKDQQACVLVEQGTPKCFPASIFDDYCDYVYGDNKFKGIKNFDLCLSAWYGDYLTPPEEKNRVLRVNSNVKYYWK